jgi:hypothetical protein
MPYTKFLDLLFEESPHTPTQVVHAGPAAARPTPITVSYGSLDPVTVCSSPLYKILAEKTDISAIPALAQLEAFAKPLESIIPDKSQRYKAALAQASAQKGFDAAHLSGAFDSLLAILSNEETTFSSQLAEQSRTQVEAKTTQAKNLDDAITNKQAEIANLEQQKQNLITQVDLAKAKIAQTQANFTAALSIRRSEITKQKDELTQILQ